MTHNSETSPLLVIVGETATGKSKLAMELAVALNGEIICGDSWTVRRELNIGTDKPSQQDQTKVRHHLIDIVEPCADFTAAVFKGLANKAIEDIWSRSKLPILVGGSGLYIDSVVFDYGFLNPADPELRAKLNDLSVEELLQKIKDLDLPLSSNIDQRNKRRLIRLIESGGENPKKSSIRQNSLLIGVRLRPEEHKKSIEQRVDRMLKRGLEEEARILSSKYGWRCEAMRGVGYKQWRRYFDGQQTLEDTRMQIISATNNLAKKQRTWFKRNKSIHWLKQPIKIDQVVDLVTTKLSI